MLVLKRVQVTYRLQLDPAADRSKVERAYRAHAPRCPVYRSIHPQVEVRTALEIVDA